MIERQRWTGQKQVIERRLQDVLYVELEERRAKYGKLYRPAIFLITGEQIPIIQDYTNEQDAKNAAYRIEQFLPNTSSFRQLPD